jgi:hypothetical protein
MRFTRQQFTDYEARHIPKTRLPAPADAVDRESDLHDQIIQFCKDKGWYYVHSRRDKRTTNQVGCPDFILAGEMGNTYWVECKRKGGKPSTAQLAAMAHLNKLRHCAGIVSSMSEFMELIK